MPVKDMTGQRFTRLVVIGRAESDANGNAKWHCICDCGATTISLGFALRDGQSKSCGCLTTEQLIDRNSTHKLSKTPEYRTWAGMLQRCKSLKREKSYLYSEKGIRVCERWHTFENFYADMGPRPGPKHSIERKDGNGNYEPKNCYWASIKEQNNNTEQNHIVTYRGESMTFQQALDKSGNIVTRGAVRGRLARGWHVDQAFDTPPGGGKTSMIGKKFGRWTVVNDDISNRTKWGCRCDCGTLRDVSRSNLRGGLSQSCGCLMADAVRSVFAKIQPPEPK